MALAMVTQVLTPVSGIPVVPFSNSQQSNSATRYKRRHDLGSSGGLFDDPILVVPKEAPAYEFDSSLLSFETWEPEETVLHLPRPFERLKELNDSTTDCDNETTSTEKSVTQQQEPKIVPQSDTARGSVREFPDAGSDEMSSSNENILDPNLRVADPHTYFENLHDLRQKVIQTSEFFRCRGEYRFSSALPDVYWLKKPSSVPTNVWDRCCELARDPFVSTPNSREAREDPSHFVKIYLILSWVTENVSMLHRLNFCKGFYSLLLEHPEHDLAEIIQIPRKTVSDLKESLEPVLLEWSSESGFPSLKNTEERCSAVLGLLGITGIPSTNTLPLGKVLWTTAVLLDLALVSYVGSHGLDFGLGLKKGDQFGAEIPGVFGFRCRLSRTTCLNEFLDSKKIWTFHLFTTKPLKGSGRLSIVTHIEEFADLWGPVWAETVSANNHELIRWYSVSNGYIRRTTNSSITFRDAKPCHWYFETDITRITALGWESDDEYLRKDDLLIIGSVFSENKNCGYSIDQFAAKYWIKFGYLGTRPDEWRSELRNMSFSISKMVGFVLGQSQKLVPGCGLKGAIQVLWSEDSLGDIRTAFVLYQRLGVEISHCTGNARRVMLKSLFLHKGVQLRLNMLKPGWTETQWGAAFKEALSNDDPTTFLLFWERHPEHRSHIAALVRSVFRLLSDTGAGPGDTQFKAAFLHPENSFFIELPMSGNEWAKCLSDSETTAAYAVVSETCLECRIPNHSTSICGDARDFTVLHTQIVADSRGELNLAKLLPQNLVLAKADEDPKPQDNNILMVVTPQVKRLLSMWYKPKVDVREFLARQSESVRPVDILVRATTKRFGGMETCRDRELQLEGSGNPHSQEGSQSSNPGSREEQPGPRSSPE